MFQVWPKDDTHRWTWVLSHCLGGSHNVSTCQICLRFMLKARADQAARLKAALWEKGLCTSVPEKPSESPWLQTLVPISDPSSQQTSNPPSAHSVLVVPMSVLQVSPKRTTLVLSRPDQVHSQSPTPSHSPKIRSHSESPQLRSTKCLHFYVSHLVRRGSIWIFHVPLWGKELNGFWN